MLTYLQIHLRVQDLKVAGIWIRVQGCFFAELCSGVGDRISRAAADDDGASTIITITITIVDHRRHCLSPQPPSPEP